MAAPTSAALANQMSVLIDRWRKFTTQHRDWLAGTAAGGPNGDGTYPLTDSLGVTAYVACPAAQEARVNSTVNSAGTYADTAQAAADAAVAARLASEQARDIANSHVALTQAARDLANTYADTAGSHAANAKVYRDEVLAAAPQVSADAATVAQAVVDVEADRVAAEAAKVAAEAAAANAQTFDPSSYYTKTVADGRFRLQSVAISYGSLSGIPSTFAPSAHTHAIGEVTGLQGALDAKLASSAFTWANLGGKPATFAPSAHTHATADVTGLDTALAAKAPVDRPVFTSRATAQKAVFITENSAGAWEPPSGRVFGNYYNEALKPGAVQFVYDYAASTYQQLTVEASQWAFAWNGTGPHVILGGGGVDGQYQMMKVVGGLRVSGTYGQLGFSDRSTNRAWCWYAQDDQVRLFNGSGTAVAFNTSGYIAYNGGAFGIPWTSASRPALQGAGLQHSDWNACLDNGWYMSATAANAPSAGVWYMGRVTQHNADWIQQELWVFTDVAKTTRWKRHRQAGTWSAWSCNQQFGNAEIGQWPTSSAYTGLFHSPNGAFLIMSGAAGVDLNTYISGMDAGSEVRVRPGNNNANVEFRTAPDAFRFSGAPVYQLAANGAAWVRVPRIFVGTADVAQMATDDLLVT